MATNLDGFGARLRHQYPDLLRIFRLIRYSLQLATVTVKSTLSPRQLGVKRRLNHNRDLKVQFGSGPAPAPGWINMDGSYYADVQLDLRRRLPLQPGTVAYIFTEHFLITYVSRWFGISCVNATGC